MCVVIGMLKSYTGLRSVGEATIEVKRSRFIARAGPVDTEEAAMRFVRAVQEEHATATHNVFAFEIGLDHKTQRFSDDGEPNGTAGKPVLEVLRAHDLMNAVIVVTRYFGGTLLGAGGLIRAYGQAASEGVKAAGLVMMQLYHAYQVRFDYRWLGKVEHTVRKDCIIEDSAYGADVRMKILIPYSLTNAVLDELRDLTSASIEVKAAGTAYLPSP